MTAPDSQATQMQAAAPKSPKLVKIRALSAILVTQGHEKVSVAPGQIVEVSEEEAKEFADRVFTNGFSFAGEHSESFAEANRHRLKRAERLH